ncbi:hypothetical protein [Streptomyces sp. IB201691-2A2]|uniref:hypothetical protein n=1 Tax=Streptomyces sp. IB201691-2A2 TaxID=2561920 RepID=UPI0021B0A20C|nr:hypothetical protein [Streptomyces sp. IB201691-2A2]
MSTPSDRSQEPLMTVRAAVILMLGAQIPVAAGVLTVLAGNARLSRYWLAGEPSPAPLPSHGR